MVNERDRSQSPPKAGKHKRIRWLPLLLGVAVVLVSGSVVADVVLTYVANTGVGASAASPFQWGQGNNYATANTLGLATTTFPGGTGTTGPAMTTVVSGISNVNVELVNVNTFGLAITLSGSTSVAFGGLIATGPASVTSVPSELVCAYAIITDYVPGTTGIYAGGTPAGCDVFIPSVGPLGEGCGSSTYAVVNLMTGAIGGPNGFAASCGLPGGSPSGTSLYVSFAIYTDNPITTGSSLGTFSVPLVIS